MLIAGVEGKSFVEAVYFYYPDDDHWSYAGLIGRDNGYASATYSEQDDCFYALGSSGPDGYIRMAIVRFTPDGKAEWRIPVSEQIFQPGQNPPTGPPQIAAAGSYVAILTPPMPDPLDAEAPAQPRCVLMDPKTDTVLYSGPMAPHPDTGALP